MGFLSGSAIRDLPARQEPQEMQVGSLGQEDPLEEGIVTCSSILSWRIPWQRSLVGYRAWDHKRVRHDLATKPEEN